MGLLSGLAGLEFIVFPQPSQRWPTCCESMFFMNHFLYDSDTGEFSHSIKNFVYVYRCFCLHVCAWCAGRPEEGIGCLGTRVNRLL